MAAGSWVALTVSDNFLKGVASTDFEDPDYREFDTGRKTTNHELAARRLIETRLAGMIPDLIVKSDGAEEFMDAAIGVSNFIDRLIEEMYGWAFLVHYYEQERMSATGVFSDKMERAEERFEKALTAFARYVPMDSDFIDVLEGTADTDLSSFENIVFVG